jgi:hypothetical protein
MKSFKQHITEAFKVGDIVKITSKDLVYEYEKNTGNDFFDYSFDPQGGGGGWDPFESSIASKYANSWLRSNGAAFGSSIDYFLPKSPILQKLKLKAKPFSNDYTYSHNDAFPVVGKVRPIERYKFIIDEATYKTLPTDVIGTSQYDYSFHAGDGEVTSWIMAIGKSQADVKSKLDKALKKVKVQYVGSEMELKYAQTAAIGR